MRAVTFLPDAECDAQWRPPAPPFRAALIVERTGGRPDPDQPHMVSSIFSSPAITDADRWIATSQAMLGSITAPTE